MIVVVGFMGAGKTTVGRVLAERLGLPFLDSDRVIEEAERRPIARIFAEDGQTTFRDIEERAIAGLLEGPLGVLSLGGGACGRARTRGALRSHTVVHLHVTLEQALSRTGRDGDRPMLRDPDLPGLYAGRVRVYEQVADVTVDTTGRPVGDVAQEIIDRITDSAGPGGPDRADRTTQARAVRTAQED